MKHILLLPAFSFFFILIASIGNPAWAQVYRCSAPNGGPPEYINNAKDAQARGCKLVAGGNITVMTGSPVPKTPAVRVASVAQPTSSAPRPDASPEQRARESDTRTILEAELKKAEARLAEQKKEYNNGEPEKQGIEGRNYQRYLDRVAELKANIARSESDVAGLKRELSRLPAAAN